MPHPPEIRRLLLDWYVRARRDLPWRSVRDPWRILLSEVMLQQTRVSVVIPYYERFLERFPTPAALAAAPESDLLALWSGLGYYARARNLKKTAAAIVDKGEFPQDYEAILKLPGVGAYTAAAVASIAFDLPHAVLDGNVVRVMSRLLAERADAGAPSTRARLQQEAQALLDPARPGDFNQALMELGATVCLPRDPQCLLCPLRDHCEARKAGIERELPVKLRKRDPLKITLQLLVVEKKGCLLLRQRAAGESRLAGFWELPESRDLPNAKRLRRMGSFRHSITRHDYEVEVWTAEPPPRAPRGFAWRPMDQIDNIPLATTVRKALQLSRKAARRGRR